MRKLNPNDLENDEESLYAERTVEGEYVKNKSLGAIALKEEKKRARKERRERERALGEFYEKQQASTAELQQFQQGLARASASGRVALNAGAKRIASRSTLRWAIWVSAMVCFWQFVFGVISLLGFVIQAYVVYVQEETILGKVVALVWDFSKDFPGEMIGYGFWALATIVGLGGFICFIIFFYLFGVRMLNTTIGTLLFALCFAATILPVSNIFPSLLVWVLYLNSTLLFSKSE